MHRRLRGGGGWSFRIEFGSLTSAMQAQALTLVCFGDMNPLGWEGLLWKARENLQTPGVFSGVK